MILKYFPFLKLAFLAFLCPQILIAQESEEKENIDKKYCNIQKMSSLTARLGASDRFITSPNNDFYKTPNGFNASGQLTLPFMLNPKFYLLFKAAVGGSINPIKFQLEENSEHGTDLYSNLYLGLGLGKAFIWQPHKKNESFVAITPFVNVIYFPFVEEFKDEDLRLAGTDYLFDANNNLSDKNNFSIVPEIKIDYHFKFYGCNSISLGLYYSRGISNAFVGDVWIKDPDGEVSTHSYKKPFTAYGLAIGYNIFNRKE